MAFHDGLDVLGRTVGFVRNAVRSRRLLFAEHPAVERAGVVRAEDGSGRIEVVVGPPSMIHAVSHAGAAVRSAVADADGVRLTPDAPVGADVRDLVEAVTDDYPGASLVSQRDRDREATAAGRPDGMLGALTDRQREALEAAYRAGYFDWPRDSTATEVAESLDLASATLHGHLRKAQASIFAALFDGERALQVAPSTRSSRGSGPS